MPVCPLCANEDLSELARDRLRPYYHCAQCDLAHVPREFHIPESEEAHRYRQHNNDPKDPAYRAFLETLLDPLRRHMPAGPQKGLDYGSGPGPAISVILGEEGHEIANYDPLFAPFGERLNERYGLVTCTEVVEHFANPGKDWEKLFKASAGGLLGVMTHMTRDDLDFTNWYYKNDPTHICFYSPKTMRFIAQKSGSEILEMGERYVVFRVPAEARA